MVTKSVPVAGQKTEADAVSIRTDIETGRVSDIKPRTRTDGDAIKTVFSVDGTLELIKRINESLDRGERVVVLVFGKKLKRDGTLDEKGTQVIKELARLYKEIEQASGANIDKVAVLLTGGRNSSYLLRGVKLPSEASVMFKALQAEGVDPANLLLEQKSYDTVTNVLFSYPIVKGFGATTVVVVAEEYMAERALRIASSVFDKSDTIFVKPVRIELSPLAKAFEELKEWLAIRALPLFIDVRRRQHNLDRREEPIPIAAE